MRVLFLSVFVFASSFSISTTSLAYVPTIELIGSPALLVDYSHWFDSQREFSLNDTEKNSFKRLVEMIYDFDINRPWGKSYFPELSQRFSKFQHFLCDQGRFPISICGLSPIVKTERDLLVLKSAIRSPALLGILEQRWKVAIDSPDYKNRQRPFNLILSTDRTVAEISGFEGKSPMFWKFDKSIPISDIDTYLEGFESREFAGQFALVKDGIQVNDWLLRSRAMDFAHEWKQEKDRDLEARRAGNLPKLSEIFDAKVIFSLKMYDQVRFEAKYQELLKLIPVDSKTHNRFLLEHSLGKYPEEVYQHISYEICLDVLKKQSVFFLKESLKAEPRSIRQTSLHSILDLMDTLESPLFLRAELFNRAQPLMSFAFVIDQMITADIALVFAYEEVKAVLGIEEYSQDNQFQSYSDLFLNPEIWDEYYLKEHAPNVIPLLKDSQGNRCKYSDLSIEDRRTVLYSYLYSNAGKLNMISLTRLFAVLNIELSPDQEKNIVSIIRKIRSK